MARSRLQTVALAVSAAAALAACTSQVQSSAHKATTSTTTSSGSSTSSTVPDVARLISEVFAEDEPEPSAFEAIGDLVPPHELTETLHASISYALIEPGRRTIASPIGFNQNREIVVRTPPGYDPSRPWPMIVMYHTWGGEAGLIIDRLEMLLGDAINEYIVAAPDDYRQTVLDAPPPVSSEHVSMWKTLRSRWHVDADRTYLAGYSLGGDTVITLTSLHPGSVAGGVAMAAGLAFPSDVDGMIETFIPQLARVPFVHSYGSEDDLNIPGLNFRPQDITLAEQNVLLDSHIEQLGLDRYIHVRLEGVGHGGAYPTTDQALMALTDPRPPLPQSFSHTFRYIHQADAYWVEGHEWDGEGWLTPWPEVEAMPGETEDEALNRTIFEELGTIEGSIRGQDVVVTSTNLADFTVWLHDELLDLDEPITIAVNDVEVFSGTVTRSSAVAIAQAHRTRDIDRLRFAGVRVNPLTGEAHVVTSSDSFPSIVRGITF